MSRLDTDEGDAPQVSSASEARADRLRQLRRLGVRKGRTGLKRLPAAPEPEEPALAPGQDSASSSGSLKELVDAVEVITPYGPCLVAESRYALTASRRGWPLAAVRECSGPAVAACGRDSQLANLDLGRAAFLDTETTGLSGGAGTFAFMVGIGTFEATAGAANAGSSSTSQSSQSSCELPQSEEDSWDLVEALGTYPAEQDEPPALEYLVRQVFMRHPGEERALLHVVEALLARCSGLVSFNGRAYDAPLLATRYLLHRQPSPLGSLPHLDLLPPARQRWRWLLSSCALGSLEQEILGYRRSLEDVPGWLIPSIYQQFARGGDAGEMARVFYHNREDIVSMVYLAAILCAPFEEQGMRVSVQDVEPAEMVALGTCFESLGWLEAGELAYRQALAGTLSDRVRTTSLVRLGWLLKRQERRAEALEVWQQWITSVPANDPTPYVELAKHYEWHEVDLEVARKWTLWGLHTVRQLPEGPRRERAQAALQHRLDRLERKLAAGGDS